MAVGSSVLVVVKTADSFGLHPFWHVDGLLIITTGNQYEGDTMHDGSDVAEVDGAYLAVGGIDELDAQRVINRVIEGHILEEGAYHQPPTTSATTIMTMIAGHLPFADNDDRPIEAIITGKSSA